MGPMSSKKMKRFWLLKTEPSVFSIQDLGKAPEKTTFWDGVRNFQARNLIRDQMQIGDGVLFYHSSAEPPVVAGTAIVVRAATPDPSQFDKKGDHYDADSTREEPKWYGVHIKLDKIWKRPIPLDELKTIPELKDMVLLQRSRLSVQPVTFDEWHAITTLAAKK
jgi:predicted RNA-binding protein with PUA-like domain